MDGKPEYLDDEDDDNFQQVLREARSKQRGVERTRRLGPDNARPGTQFRSLVCLELLSAAAIVPIAISWVWREWLAES